MCQGDSEKMVADKITVVQILPELESGGVERGTLEIGRFLATEGHTSLVVSQGGQMVTELESQGSCHLQMNWIGEKTPRCLLHLPALRRLFASGKVDLVHLRSRLPAWVALLALKSLPPAKRPMVVTTFHGFYSVNAYSAVMTRGQKVIAISRAVADHLRQVYGIAPSRIRVIYRGIDENWFAPRRVSDNRLARARAWLRLGDALQPLILLPGRVTFVKGHKVLLKALAGMKDLGWQAVFLGYRDPGSKYCQDLEKLCRQLGLSQRVTFIPPYEDMPAAYAASQVVVSATFARPEAFGRVAVEAQAMQRPVVASAHGGSLETVLHGTTGFLFTPGDHLQLRRRLEQLLANPKMAQDMGIKGRRWVLRNFTTAGMCRKTMAVYREVLAQRQPLRR